MVCNKRTKTNKQTKNEISHQVNTIPPSVSNKALGPNQPRVVIENPGKFHDDVVSAL